jgi:ubiquinone/menaquinone biosynthesis C-methylase UbiE
MSDAGTMFNDGKVYERMMGRWSKRVGVQFLDWLDPPKNLKWIEAGCGNGAFTEELIAHCAPLEVTALDPSEGQLKFARTRPAAKMAKFQIGDAQSLPFPDKTFDAAVMALVITFIPDPAKAIRELTRVVRPGGTVATYMWDIAGGGLPLAPIGRAFKAMGKDYARVSETAAKRDVMQSLWEGAGLQAVETRVIRITVNFVSFEDFCESSLVPVGPAGQVLTGMSPAERQELHAQVRKQLPIAADGSIAYEAFANAVRGIVPG